MARIRTIKPQFFRHEALFDAERESGLPLRLAFAGLWTAADREGRFKWKPRELKLDCLPHDDVDFSRVLDALTTRGFIQKYTIDGKEYGCIPSWRDHQIINNRETASEIPKPADNNNNLTRGARVADAWGTPLNQVQGEGKGKEEERKMQAAPALDEDGDLFRRGKQILGADAGSLISKLKKARGGVSQARAVIEQAATKENPREYVGRVLAGPAKARTSSGELYPEGII